MATHAFAPASAPDRAAPARGHLRMVDGQAAPTFSQLPHAILRDTSLSRDARLLYAVLQGHWWQGTESYASHAEMAAEMGCSLSGIRRYLDELIAAGLIAEGLAGTRRAKVYIRLPIRQNDGIGVAVNRSPVTDCEPSNTSKPTIQYVKTDDSNTSKPTHSYKKTPEKKTPVEDTPLRGVVAADAAPAPPPPAKRPKKQVRSKRPSAEETTAPETIELTDVSYASALKMGFDREAVDFELERFLSKARSKGWTYLSWRDGFKTWLLNEAKWAKRDGRTVGSTPAPRQNAKPRDDDHLKSSVHMIEEEVFYVGDPDGN